MNPIDYGVTGAIVFIAIGLLRVIEMMVQRKQNKINNLSSTNPFDNDLLIIKLDIVIKNQDKMLLYLEHMKASIDRIEVMQNKK